MEDASRYEVNEIEGGTWIVVQRWARGINNGTTLVSREYNTREEAEAEMQRLIGVAQ